MLFIPFALLLVALALCAVRQMHFFQLNSYKWAEHKVWLRRNAFDLSILGALALISLASLLFGAIGRVIFLSAVIGAFALLSIPKSKKKSKKPIVFTPRVIRMLIAEAVIYLVAAAAFCLLAPLELLPVLTFALLLIAPYMCLVVNLTNAPIESSIRKGFTREAISMLRSHPSLRVVGITGSYGKTSTKYYLSTILSEKFDVLMTPGSFNTPMGVVKTVRESLRPTHEVFICEMGAKYVGDIKELCEIADPEIGIISSIGAQHLETFGSLENIVSTKLELYDHLIAKGGKAVLNGNCDLIRDNVKGGILYGKDGDLKISDVHANARGSSFTVSYKDIPPFSMSVSLLGAHNVSNVAGAVAVALELGMTPDEIKRAARKIKCAPHRLEIKPFGENVIIDDAYNANPAGTKAALASLGLFEGYCKIIVTPGMVELGSDSDRFNKTLGADASAVCDYIFLVGSFGSEIIKSGALEAGYPEDKIFIYARVEDAINAARVIPSDLPRAILLENDLPDNY